MQKPKRTKPPSRKPARRRKLTELFVKKAKKPEAGRALYWDDDPKRLALSVEASGHKSWKLVYSLHGRVRWYTIGDCDAIGLADARKIAHKLMGQIADGKDPQAEKRAARQAGTFEELAQRYVEEHAKRRNKSWAQADLLVHKYLLQKWGKLRVRDIRRADMRAIFRKLTDDGAPVLANQVLAAASAIFSWAIKTEVAELAANPCSRIERNLTVSRERVLSDTELPIFWKAFDEAGLIASTALKLILLTGQRPGEVCHMRREHLEISRHRFTDANGRAFEAEGAWWNLPGQPDKKLGWPGTKNAQSHRAWLPKAVVALIQDIDEDARDGFVFASAHGRSIQQLDQPMRRVCDRLGLADGNRATPHDLRRTFSTTVTSLGFTRDQLNRQTNHKEGGIASVYDRHGYADEARRIAEAVCAKLMALAEGEAVERKVVPLHA